MLFAHTLQSWRKSFDKQLLQFHNLHLLQYCSSGRAVNTISYVFHVLVVIFSIAESMKDQGYCSGPGLSRDMTMEYFCRTIASDLWIWFDLLLLFSSFSAVQFTTGALWLPIDKIHNLFHIHATEDRQSWEREESRRNNEGERQQCSGVKESSVQTQTETGKE